MRGAASFDINSQKVAASLRNVSASPLAAMSEAVACECTADAAATAPAELQPSTTTSSANSEDDYPEGDEGALALQAAAAAAAACAGAPLVGRLASCASSAGDAAAAAVNPAAIAAADLILSGPPPSRRGQPPPREREACCADGAHGGEPLEVEDDLSALPMAAAVVPTIVPPPPSLRRRSSGERKRGRSVRSPTAAPAGDGESGDVKGDAGGEEDAEDGGGPDADGADGGSKANRKASQPWTLDEDALLQSAVHRLGPKRWSAIAQTVVGRTGKQCRLRWCNQIDPSIRHDAWTEAEDAMILRAQATLGSRWTEIAKLLPVKSPARPTSNPAGTERVARLPLGGGDGRRRRGRTPTLSLPATPPLPSTLPNTHLSNANSQTPSAEPISPASRSPAPPCAALRRSHLALTGTRCCRPLA